VAEIVCVNCGETDELRGERTGEIIEITCESCGLVWTRDTTPTCSTCGSRDVRPAFQAIVDKSRGTQLSVQSMRLVHLCPHCEPEQLADYLKSNSPLTPKELPFDPDV
jgi:hypothetical protein